MEVNRKEIEDKEEAFEDFLASIRNSCKKGRMKDFQKRELITLIRLTRTSPSAAAVVFVPVVAGVVVAVGVVVVSSAVEAPLMMSSM